MKTELLVVGRTVDQRFSTLIADYVSRLSHYMPFAYTVLPDLKNTRSLSAAQQREREGELILRHVSAGDALVLFDEHGRERRSVEFADWLSSRQQAGKRLVLCIGGPYGFSPAVYERANDKVSLSAMTFSHQMVRLIAVEQLYRACTIIKGEPYHHE